MMGQTSGPITGENFTDQTWRDMFGAEPAIVGDVNGTAYRLTLPTSTNDVQLGSPSQDSLAVDGGKVHKIPAGETASLTIPTSSNASVGRTDLIVLRFDPALSGDSPLGPVRLYRIAGTEGSATQPNYDGGPPGVEDLPLYAITRKSGQALNQAAVKDLRVRTGPNLLYQAGVTFAAATPLGTRATRDGVVWRRDLDGGSPAWVRESPWPLATITNGGIISSEQGYSAAHTTVKITRGGVDGRDRYLFVQQAAWASHGLWSSETGDITNQRTFRLINPADWPEFSVEVPFRYTRNADGAQSFGHGILGSDGYFTMTNLMPNQHFQGRGIASGDPAAIFFSVTYRAAGAVG
jgi:hypothetical protein